MSNSNLPASVAGLATGLAASAQTAAAGEGQQFMKFTKFGEFVFGADNIEVEPGSEWAINPQGFGHGWIAWGDAAHGTEGEMLGGVMASASGPMPAQPGPVEGTWSEQRAIQLACVSGEDAGVQALFKANSLGGKKMYARIVMEVVKRINAGQLDIVPVVHLTADSYQHTKYGKIFTPDYKLVRWTTMDDAVTAPAVEEEEEAPEPATPTRRRRAAA